MVLISEEEYGRLKELEGRMNAVRGFAEASNMITVEEIRNILGIKYNPVCLNEKLKGAKNE